MQLVCVCVCVRVCLKRWQGFATFDTSNLLCQRREFNCFQHQVFWLKQDLLSTLPPLSVRHWAVLVASQSHQESWTFWSSPPSTDKRHCLNCLKWHVGHFLFVYRKHGYSISAWYLRRSIYASHRYSVGLMGPTLPFAICISFCHKKNQFWVQRKYGLHLAQINLSLLYFLSQQNED